MNQLEETQGQLLAVSIVVAICGVVALLVFFAWLARGNRRKRPGVGSNKRPRSARKKRRQ